MARLFLLIAFLVSPAVALADGHAKPKEQPVSETFPNEIDPGIKRHWDMRELRREDLRKQYLATCIHDLKHCTEMMRDFDNANK